MEQQETMGEMLARHRLEMKQLENKVAEMKKAAPEGSKAEQKAKTKQVEEDISKLSTKLKEKQLKEVASQGYSSSFKDEAKEKKSTSGGEWTVVLPSKGRQARRKPKPKGQKEEEEGQPRDSDDLELDPQRQARLKHNMEISMKEIESSEFYKAFLEQIKSPEVSGHFSRVLGSETQLQMVMYGIGSIESYQSPRFQLSIAILMTREFDWVGNNIEVFDPILSATESSVLKSLGCTVLSENEQARREALKPTLFFMPHCEANLYKNLLQANWRMDRLSKIALFGNSFHMYEEQVLFDQKVIEATKVIIAARRITSEFAIETVSDDYFAAFHDSSWHFFSTGLDSELPLLV